MRKQKNGIIFIAQNLTAPGGIESVSRMIVENLSLYGITQVVDLNRKVKTGVIRYLSRISSLPQIFQIIFLVSFRNYSRIMISHVAIAKFLLIISRKTRILILCHGGEVWQNKKLLKLASEKRITWVAVSQFTKKKMEEFVGQQRVFANEIRLLRLSSPIFSYDTKSSFRKAPLSFLCVSRLDKTSRYKGVDTAIQIFNSILLKHPSARLTIVGAGNDIKYYSELISRLDLEKSICLKGYLTQEELAEEYLRNQFFLLPGRPTISRVKSEGEGFGIVFIEASYFGAIPIGGIGDGAESAIIQNLTGLLVDGRKIDEASNQILEIIDDESKLNEMMKQGRNFVVSNHSDINFEFDLQKALEKL